MYEKWLDEVKEYSRGGMFTFKDLPDELRNLTQLKIHILRNEICFVGQINQKIAYIVNNNKDVLEYDDK